MKITRRTKLLIVALALCFTTMIGSTFAWFTDSAESAVNTIQSGNLDMKVSYKPYGTNYTEWKEVTKTEKLFKENALYEPGYTEAIWLKIENAGNLAFRYQAALNILTETKGTNKAGQQFNLSDYLVVKSANVTDVEGWEESYPTRASLDNFAFGAAANSGEKALNSKDLTIATNAVAFPENDPTMGDYSTSYVLVILQMPTTVGNEANHDGTNVPKIEFGLNVVATQLVYESDSFGNDYDADATYPVIGQVDIYNEADFAKVKEGGIANLCADVTLTENVTLPADTVLRGNGKQINGTIVAGGDLTIEGHVKVTSFSASYYDRTITIGEGACLEITGGDRVSLAYGNTFNITGKLDNAKTADKANVQPSLIIPGGISITGGSDAAMNVTNAYVKIGNTSSSSSANGNFTLNFTNSIAEFTHQLTMSENSNGNFIINIQDSVLTTPTKFIVAAPQSTVVIDNSTITLGSYFRNSGNVTLKNNSVLTGATIQFGENGGNDGITIVDSSTFTIKATSTGHALDGKGTGKLVLQNGATATVDYYKALDIEVDATSKFTGTEVQ